MLRAVIQVLDTVFLWR